MERLTEFRKDLNRYEYKQDEKGYCFIQEGQIINKLGKLEDLEEKLGCPLEVYVKIRQSIIEKVYIQYLGEMERMWIMAPIAKNGFGVVNGFITKSCFWKDYKKTWWLKEDKSE